MNKNIKFLCLLIFCIFVYFVFFFIYQKFPFFWIGVNKKPSNEAIISFATGIVSSIALAFAIYAITLQKEDLENSRKELQAQIKELNEQNAIMKEQKFEETFNALYINYKKALQNSRSESIDQEYIPDGDYLERVLINISQKFYNHDTQNKKYLTQKLMALSFIFNQFFFLVASIGNNSNLDKSSQDLFFKRLSLLLSPKELVFIALYVIESDLCDNVVVDLIKEHNILEKLKTDVTLSHLPSSLSNIKMHIIKNTNKF